MFLVPVRVSSPTTAELKEQSTMTISSPSRMIAVFPWPTSKTAISMAVLLVEVVEIVTAELPLMSRFA